MGDRRKVVSYHLSPITYYSFDVARLRTDPQHTPPLLPLLRSRPGGVHKASVVRSPKSDKLSKTRFRRPPANSYSTASRAPRANGLEGDAAARAAGGFSSAVEARAHAAQVGGREL